MLDNLRKLQALIPSGSLQNMQKDGGVEKLLNQTLDASIQLEKAAHKNLLLEDLTPKKR